VKDFVLGTPLPESSPSPRRLLEGTLKAGSQTALA